MQEHKLNGVEYYFLVHITISIVFFIAHSFTYKEHNEQGKKEINIIYSKTSIFALIIGYIIYIIFAVFRRIDHGYGGIDAISYKQIFESSINLSFGEFNAIRKEELLYNFITWLIGNFTNDFKYVLLVMHSISYICFAVTYKYISFKENKLINSLYTFVIIGWLFTMFNTLRFGVALSLAMLAYIKLTNNKNQAAIFYLIIACLFHTSSVILLPPFLLCIYYKHTGTTSKSRTSIIAIICIIVEIVLMPVVSRLLLNTAYNSYGATNGIALGTFIIVVISIIITILRAETVKSAIINDNFVFLICSLLCIPIQLRYSVAYRMVIMFMPIIYKNLIDLIYSESVIDENSVQAQKRLFYLDSIILLFSFIYLIYRAYTLYTVDFVGDGLYPYVNTLF